MYKNKFLLILLVISMIAIGAVTFTACKPTEEDPNGNDIVEELPVPIDQIESIALKEGTIPEIFRIGEDIDYETAKLLITLKVPEEETGEEETEEQTEETEVPEEEEEETEPPVEVAVTAEMVQDFSTEEVGVRTMKIVYSSAAPQFDVICDYEVISETTFFVTYDLNDGAFGAEVDERFDSSLGIPELPVPVKDYYEFAGWYSDETFTSEVHTAVSAGVQSNVMLYARWTPITYILTFQAEYLTVSAVSYTVESVLIELPVINTDGIEQGEFEVEPESLAFAGWYESDTYPANGRKITYSTEQPENKIFYAKWEPKVTVTLNQGFETRYPQGAALSTVKSSAKLTVTDYYGAVINNNVAVTDAMVSNFASDTPGDYTLTITYKYGTLDYTVEADYEVTESNIAFLNYVLNEGSFTSSTPDRFVKEDGLATLPVPERTAYDFAGWYTSDNTLKESFPANYTTLKTTLYAKWTPTSYTVSYYLNHETAFDYTDNYTLLDSLDLWEGAEREAYHFMGWYANQNYIGTPVTSIDDGNYGNKAFYAKWGAKVTSVAITSLAEFNVKDGQMQLTASVLPGGADPAVFPNVTYYYVNEIFEGKNYYTGIEYNEDKIIEDGVFIAHRAGYAVIKGVADGVESELFTVKVIVEDVEEILVLNDPLVVFPGSKARIELDFEPFTAVASLPITYEITNCSNGIDQSVSNANDGLIVVNSGFSDFAFTVMITYGSEENEIQKEVVFNVPKSISNKEELLAIDSPEELSGYYVLTDDIDLTGVNWNPIGYAEQIGNDLNYDNAFKGMFFGGDNNGEPYKIKNMTIDMAEVTYLTAGLFGSVYGAYIDGVVLENISITGACANGTDYIGGIAGANALSKMFNCAVTGVIDIDNGMYVGGLVGQMYGSMQNVKTYIDNEEPEVDSELAITVRSALANLSVGGLVGLFLNGTIEDADAIVNITIENCYGAKVGGLAGDSRDRLNDSTAEAVISITEAAEVTIKTNQIKAGGAAGAITEALNGITAIADITITGKGQVYAGGIAGVASDITGCDSEFSVDIITSDSSWIGGLAGTSNVITDSISLITGLNIVSTETTNIGGLVGSAIGATEGIGSVETEGDADIVLNAKNVNFGGITGLAAAVTDGEFECLNCTVILNASAAANAGGIAGLSSADVLGTAAIYSLSVTTKTAYVGGIAGKTTASANGDFSAESIMISADVSASAAYVGGIAGYAADISDSSATCVLIDVVAFDACVGGIAGQVINSVTNSDATGDISCTVKKTGTASFAGGLVGKIGSNVLAAISGCTSEVDIEAISVSTGNFYIGGIAGQAAADISDSNASGTIDADSNKNGELVGGTVIYAGGLVGQLNYVKVGQVYVGSLTDSFSAIDLTLKAIGNAAGSVYGGGVVGHNKGTVERCYYDDGQMTAYAYDKLYVGGLVGFNEVSSGSPALIADCYASGGEITVDMSASGSLGYAGGLVGGNSGTVNMSYAKMKLSGTARGSSKTLNIGGFAGINTLNINASFVLNYADAATVSVQAFTYEDATIYVGGFIGANNGASGKIAAISDAYTAANVAADAYTGGFVGSNNAYGTISYALSLGEVNKSIVGNKAGAFASRGLTGYTKCYYSTTAAGTVMSPVAEGAVQEVEGHSASTLRNNPYLYSDFNSEIWAVTTGSYPTIIFNSEIWTAGENGPVLISSGQA